MIVDVESQRVGVAMEDVVAGWKSWPRRRRDTVSTLVVLYVCILGSLAVPQIVPVAGPHPDADTKFYLLDIKLPESALSATGTHNRILTGIYNILKTLPFHGLKEIHSFKVLGESRLSILLEAFKTATDSRLHLEAAVQALEGLGTTIRNTPLYSFEAWAESLIGLALPEPELHLLTRGKPTPLDYSSTYRSEITFSSEGLTQFAYQNMLRNFTINVLKARATNLFRFSCFKVIGNLKASFEFYISEQPSVMEQHTLNELIPFMYAGNINVNTEEVLKLHDLLFPIRLPPILIRRKVLVHGK